MENDAIDWLSEPYCSHLSAWVKNVVINFQGNITLCTDSMEAARRFKSVFKNVHYCNSIESAAVIEGIAFIMADCGVSQDDEVIVIDFHNLLLDTHQINSAIALYREKQGPVVSTKIVRGLSQQFARFDKINLATSVHLFDMGYHSGGQEYNIGNIADYCVTHPFLFHWDEFLGNFEPGAYFQAVSRDGVKYFPVKPDDSDHHKIILILIDKNTSRLAICRDLCGDALGASLPETDGHSEIYIRKNGGKTVFEVKHEKSIIVALPFNEKGLLSEGQLSGKISDGKVTVPICNHMKSITGFVVTVSEPVYQGVPDSGMSFRPDFPLWVDDRTGVSKNSQNGKRIVGRQGASKLYMMTADIIIGRRSELQNITSHLDSGEVYSFLLPLEHNSVHDSIGFLRYIAADKALKEVHSVRV